MWGALQAPRTLSRINTRVPLVAFPPVQIAEAFVDRARAINYAKKARVMSTSFAALTFASRIVRGHDQLHPYAGSAIRLALQFELPRDHAAAQLFWRCAAERLYVAGDHVPHVRHGLPRQSVYKACPTVLPEASRNSTYTPEVMASRSSVFMTKGSPDLRMRHPSMVPTCQPTLAEWREDVKAILARGATSPILRGLLEL